MSIWDDFRGAENQFKFEHPGDSIAGTLKSIRLATMPDGDKVPSLIIETKDGSDWGVLVGNVDLQRKLANLTPEPRVGDRLAIAYTHDEHVGKPSPMKRFDVAHKPGVASAAPDNDNGASPAPAGVVNAADLL